MKSLVNTYFAALFFTVASFTAAQAETHKPIGRPQKAAAFQSSMYTTSEGKLQIAVQKETTSRVLVRLLDAKGKEMFAEQIGKREEAARFRLDVSNLPDGEYQVEVSNGVETTTKDVTLASQKPTAPVRVIAVQ